jgi:hypothetical protein
MVEISKLSTSRTTKAKRAFTTRRVPARDMRTLISGSVKPVSGNIVLATVHELGKHRKVEKVNGRRALMMPGDEIIVCYGNRYAPDQFEALISDDLSLCDLVAGGGIASREVNRHARMLPPTQIIPIGLIGNEHGEPVNIADYRIGFEESTHDIKVFIVVGTAMNAGKTFTAASLVRGLKANGFKVAGIKATGTGSGGDLWQMKDMGADVVLDFTDAGFASTYKVPDEAIEEGVIGLINHAARRRCDIAVVEIADGLQHQETAALLRSNKLQSKVSGVVFAAYDSMGAKAGYDELCKLGYPVLAISGQISRSPLAMREAGVACRCPIHTPFEIQAGALVPAMTGANDHDSIILFEERRRRTMANPSHFVVDVEDSPRVAVRAQGIEGMYSLDYLEDIGPNAHGHVPSTGYGYECD